MRQRMRAVKELAADVRGNLLIAEDDLDYLNKVLANRNGTYDLKTLKKVVILIHQARNIAQGIGPPKYLGNGIYEGGV